MARSAKSIKSVQSHKCDCANCKYYHHCKDEINAILYANYLDSQNTKWISIESELPKSKTDVFILAKYGECTIITTGIYEDGTDGIRNSSRWWNIDAFEYDVDLDVYIIPEGWWEYKGHDNSNGAYCIIDDVVTHWMPLNRALDLILNNDAH